MSTTSRNRASLVRNFSSICLLAFVGLGQLAVIKLDLRDGGQVAQHRQVLLARHARLLIQHAQASRRCFHPPRRRIAHVEPKVGFSDDGGMVDKAGIELGIGHDKLLVFKDR